MKKQLITYIYADEQQLIDATILIAEQIFIFYVD